MTARVVVIVALLAGAAQAAEKVEKSEYVASLDGSTAASPWVPALVEVQVAARGGFHVNADYPSSFVVAAGEVTYPRARIDGTSVTRVPCEGKTGEACGLKLVVPYYVAKPGNYTVGGTIRFSVCDDDRCLIEKVDLARSVVAK